MKCSFCNKNNLKIFHNFGNFGLAGAFLTKKQIPSEKKYNLSIAFCNSCTAVQVTKKISPEKLFSKYFYSSSSINTLVDHYKKFSIILKKKFIKKTPIKILEIGCNDGVFIKPLSKLNCEIIGVDPAKNIIKKIKKKENIYLINDFFNIKTAKKIINYSGYQDLILASNVYAHINDISSVTKAVNMCLSNKGTFIFEVHYLLNLINENQYDMIYHEHIYYYSFMSAASLLGLHNLVIYDYEKTNIHSGSVRFYVCKKGYENNKTSLKKVKLQLNYEKKLLFHHFSTYKKFSHKITNHALSLNKLLTKLKFKGKKIYGYGASGRANTIIQFCDINSDTIEYIIDDSKEKINFYTPGSHIKIVGSKILNTHRPDYLLIFAWSFKDEIYQRNKKFFLSGGKMIIPFPKPKIIEFN